MLVCIGIGWATSKRLSTLGLETFDAVQACDQSILIQEFGTAQAQVMVQLCQGIDPSPVVSKGLPQVCMQRVGFKTDYVTVLICHLEIKCMNIFMTFPLNYSDCLLSV